MVESRPSLGTTCMFSSRAACMIIWRCSRHGSVSSLRKKCAKGFGRHRRALPGRHQMELTTALKSPSAPYVPFPLKPGPTINPARTCSLSAQKPVQSLPRVMHGGYSELMRLA